MFRPGIVAGRAGTVVPYVYPPYAPDAVRFKGELSSWLIQYSKLSLTDSKFMTCSFWVLPTDASSSETFIWAMGNGGFPRMWIKILDTATNPRLYINIQEAAGTPVLYDNTIDDLPLVLNAWNHVLFSVNVTSGSLQHSVYINDVLSTGTPATLATGDIPWTKAGTTSFVNTFMDNTGNNGIGTLDGDICDFWMDMDNYIDFSVVSNRRKFIDSDYRPERLGISGEFPTGSSPIVFISGDQSVWRAGTNSGTALDYIMNYNTLPLRPDDSLNEPVGLFLPPDAVAFDGASDYLTRSDMIGEADSNTFVMSCWIYPTNFTAGMNLISAVTSGNDPRFQIATDITTGQLNVTIKDSSGVDIWNESISAKTLTVGVWNQILISQSGTTSHVYIDDVSVAHTGPANANAIDFTVDGGWGVCAREDGDSKFNGDVSEFYFTDEYLDLSVAGNRLKFSNPLGEPIYLGPDGYLPTGTAPLVYMEGDAAVWNAGTNSGSGGNFVMTGAVTDSTNEPVDNFTAEAVDGLGEGTRATLIGGVNTDDFTLSCWVRTVAGVTRVFQGIKSGRGTDPFPVLFGHGTAAGSGLQCWTKDDLNTYKFKTAFPTVTAGVWHHVMISRTGTTVHAWLDGVDYSGSVTDKATGTINIAGVDAGWFYRDITSNVDIAEMYMNNSYIDLSVQTNRDKFIYRGQPALMGSDGSVPTGSSPWIYFSGNATVIGAGTNSGTGGNFTQSGTTTNSTNEPVEL